MTDSKRFAVPATLAGAIEGYPDSYRVILHDRAMDLYLNAGWIRDRMKDTDKLKVYSITKYADADQVDICLIDNE